MSLLLLKFSGGSGPQPHRLERHMRSTDPDFETKAADVIGLGGAVQGIRLRPRRVLIDLALERFDILLGEYDPRWRRGDRATSVRD